MFEQLNNALIAEGEAAKENGRFYIENGYWKTWNDKTPGDNGLKHHSTARRWEQYQNGEISREKAVGLATARMIRTEDKHTAKRLEKLERAAAAPDLEEVTISVEWVRNRTWGNNPTATVTIKAGGNYSTFTGSASGCGYDKLTSAIGAALNQSRSVLRMLYQAKESAMERMTPAEIRAQKNGYSFGSESNRNFIHYGAGYGVLPYFDGGVGISSFYGVFEACGFRCVEQHATKRTDYYVFTRKGV